MYQEQKDKDEFELIEHYKEVSQANLEHFVQKEPTSFNTNGCFDIYKTFFKLILSSTCKINKVDE